MEKEPARPGLRPVCQAFIFSVLRLELRGGGRGEQALGQLIPQPTPCFTSETLTLLLGDPACPVWDVGVVQAWAVHGGAGTESRDQRVGAVGLDSKGIGFSWTHVPNEPLSIAGWSF